MRRLVALLAVAVVGLPATVAANGSTLPASVSTPEHTNRIVVRENGEYRFHQLYPEGWAVVEVTNPSRVERTVLGYRLYVEWPGAAFPGNIIVDAYPTEYGKEAPRHTQPSDISGPTFPNSARTIRSTVRPSENSSDVRGCR
jgi:hypothetical protein